MNTYIRHPEWTVTIRRPDYTQTILTYQIVPEWGNRRFPVSRAEFVSSKERENYLYGYTDLIGYEYDNSISDVSNPFSLTFTPRRDNSGLSWKDKIQESDIVFISEFGKIRYIGIVRKTSYSMSMGQNENPQRSVTIAGESIGGKLKTFNLPMNVYLWYDLGVIAETENEKFTSALNSKLDEGQTLDTIFTSIKDGFFSVAFGSGSTGFPAILNKFFELDTSNLDVFYPMNLKPYQEDANTLWSIYRQILPDPVYEIFGRFEDEKYKLVCRETPFDKENWKSLKITDLNPLYLISHNLNDSDEEVFTHYYSQMPNSAFSENEIYANKSLSEISIFDQDKLSIYGYKQLKASFPFFDLDKGKAFSSKDFLKENSIRLYSWYKNNVEFQSGTITLMTVPDEHNEYINVGERIRYLQGANNSIEFYVEGVKRTMQYPDGGMRSVYTVTRGYEYGDGTVTIDGVTVKTPQVKKISQMGRKLFQIEKDVFQGGDKV